jgi:autoinducer 2-degrading protein
VPGTTHLVTPQETPRHGILDTHVQTVLAARGTVQDEPGVFQFHILTDADTPTRFYYFEIFRDEAVAEAHWETENFTTWWAAVEGMLDGDVQRISTMRPVFPSDHGLEQQKAGLLDW